MRREPRETYALHSPLTPETAYGIMPLDRNEPDEHGTGSDMFRRIESLGGYATAKAKFAEWRATRG
jgi:hypothetical protein